MKGKIGVFFIIAVSILMGIPFLLGLLFTARYAVNEAYNLAYRKGYFFDRSATLSMMPKDPEAYVQFYNTANNYFRNGRYEDAMNCYLEAIELNPPHSKGNHAESTKEKEKVDDIECNVRINLALSILYQIDFENVHLSDREEVDAAAEKLLLARSALTAGSCAHFDDPNGHNADAERLKKEIDELLKKLNKTPPGQGGDEDDNQNPDEGSDEDENKDSSEDKGIEDKIRDEMSRAKEEQEAAMRNREWQKGYAGDSEGYGFSGKSW